MPPFDDWNFIDEEEEELQDASVSDPPELAAAQEAYQVPL
jgi:hypothetical protein